VQLANVKCTSFEAIAMTEPQFERDYLESL
jgi:hypothetical protein